jgi:hypothetical protein
MLQTPLQQSLFKLQPLPDPVVPASGAQHLPWWQLMLQHCEPEPHWLPAEQQPPSHWDPPPPELLPLKPELPPRPPELLLLADGGVLHALVPR